MDGDGEAVTDGDSCDFLEGLALGVRQLSRLDTVPPFERLSHLRCPANHGIKALVAIVRVVGSSRQGIDRDQARFIVPAMRLTKIGKA